MSDNFLGTHVERCTLVLPILWTFVGDGFLEKRLEITLRHVIDLRVFRKRKRRQKLMLEIFLCSSKSVFVLSDKLN